MELVSSVKKMQEIALANRCSGKSIGLVPTMGFLHQGHKSLMIEGRKRSDLLVTSIFVNPTQFGIGEDFEKYPRDLDRDMAIAADAGVDILFVPTTTEMYPSGYQTYIDVEKITLPLCGRSRPGHFRGVTTVVAKLFGIIQPTLALFGRKDYQQLTVIRQMTADLNFPIEIVGMPIVRESDGLAMSSRNAYLSEHERLDALCLRTAIDAVQGAFKSGINSGEHLTSMALQVIAKSPNATVDYIVLCDSRTLDTVATVDENTLLALAVKIGKTRLIDNAILGER
jgi:pantoate--beta-alanine ligase